MPAAFACWRFALGSSLDTSWDTSVVLSFVDGAEIGGPEVEGPEVEGPDVDGFSGVAMGDSPA
jgi:hypothetical protein